MFEVIQKPTLVYVHTLYVCTVDLSPFSLLNIDVPSNNKWC